MRGKGQEMLRKPKGTVEAQLACRVAASSNSQADPPTPSLSARNMAQQLALPRAFRPARCSRGSVKVCAAQQAGTIVKVAVKETGAFTIRGARGWCTMPSRGRCPRACRRSAGPVALQVP